MKKIKKTLKKIDTSRKRTTDAPKCGLCGKTKRI